MHFIVWMTKIQWISSSTYGERMVSSFIIAFQYVLMQNNVFFSGKWSIVLFSPFCSFWNKSQPNSIREHVGPLLFCHISSDSFFGVMHFYKFEVIKCIAMFMDARLSVRTVWTNKLVGNYLPIFTNELDEFKEKSWPAHAEISKYNQLKNNETSFVASVITENWLENVTTRNVWIIRRCIENQWNERHTSRQHTPYN